MGSEMQEKLFFNKKTIEKQLLRTKGVINKPNTAD